MFEAIRLDAAAVNAQEEDIRLRIRDLSEDQRKAYYDRFRREVRDPDTYAVLNYFFLAGLHHMYLGNFLRGATNLALLLAGVGCFVVGSTLLGVLLVAFILSVELMALFRSQVVVAHHNNRVAEHILDDLVKQPYR